MRVFCSGFNLYGQFINCPTYVVDNFVDYTYDVTHFEPSQTFNVVTTSDGVYFHGSKCNKTHQVHKLVDDYTLTIKQIKCVDNKILMLLDNGDLFKIDRDTKELVHVTKNIKKISLGVTINVAVTNDGRLLNLPHQLEYEGGLIKKVACGREHCLILDELGKVYSFGRSSRGQLGHGHLEDELEPKIVEALDGIKMKMISAGGWHSCAISEEGDLYVWGWNSNGQLGLNESINVMASPHVVDFDGEMNANVVDVACGNRHTIALLDDGKVHGCGWNKYSQLGSVIREMNQYKFVLVCDLCNVSVKKLKCGPWSSLIIS
ncbi:hypothetical protein FQR65_LT10180 [Abscondita terminalis]|nr:hypothetical protein FQR65_LT10180 [Abscondita terminalis]